MNNASHSTATVYVPRDSAARSVGADEVAQALQHAAARGTSPWTSYAMDRAACCGWSPWSRW